MARFVAGRMLWNEIRDQAKRSRSVTAVEAFVGRNPLRLLPG
jgi:hypothetical protein